MTPEQLAKMQAGRRRQLELAKAQQQVLVTDEDATWRERHERAHQDLLRIRAELEAWR